MYLTRHAFAHLAQTRRVFPAQVGWNGYVRQIVADVGLAYIQSSQRAVPRQAPALARAACPAYSEVGTETVPEVFPTPVGVFPALAFAAALLLGLPHARGGVSQVQWRVEDAKKSSPRPWGCFLVIHLTPPMPQVFPTPVGVFLSIFATRTCNRSLPHARGGVSSSVFFRRSSSSSSPRPWGCFWIYTSHTAHLAVFPTPVGVFLSLTKPSVFGTSLPHARGGVSDFIQSGSRSSKSSPRPWGCFRALRCGRRRRTVFPTPVGVFPRLTPLSKRRRRLPHARGGVSMHKVCFRQGA